LTSVCIPLSGKIFLWQKISAAGRWRGFDFFSSEKVGRGEEIFMSGLERLGRLSLPRRTAAARLEASGMAITARVSEPRPPSSFGDS
jgi:hypothetical protein